MPDAQPAPVGGPLPRGHLLALNRSFRGALEAENKSPRTVEASTDAVRFLATYCEAHGKPLLARQLRREHIQDFVADQLARWSRPPPHNRYRSLHAFFKWAVAEGDLQASPMDGMKPPNLPEQPSVSSGQSSSSASSRPVRAGTSPAGGAVVRGRGGGPCGGRLPAGGGWFRRRHRRQHDLDRVLAWEVAMAFVLGVLLFVVVAGILDRRLIPWPKPADRGLRR